MNLLHNIACMRRYVYRLGFHRGEDTWDIWDRKASTVVASIPFWDCDAGYVEHAERKARRWVARLNRRRPLLSGRGR
ncbi:MAG: hypothetical protein QM783_15930 [Phycisphaerales bacterium]